MMTSEEIHEITDCYYSINDIFKICESRSNICLSSDTREKIENGRRYVNSIIENDELLYGINTGFGALCREKIDLNALSDLQAKLLISHACGVGEAVSYEVSRIVMFIKLLTFRSGHSGVSLELVQRIIDFWNADIIPVIPKKGTVGASGDLAPLAHMSLPLIGLGQVWHYGKPVPSSLVLQKKGFEPVRLGPKEGLCLTNGVQYINALGVSCLDKIFHLIKVADINISASIAGFAAANSFYQTEVHSVSHHPERRIVASNIQKLLDGSNHFELPECDPAKEDPYSLRCAPQVHAAVRQAVSFAAQVIERECNSVSDNPLVFWESKKFLTCGNLHGESTAIALDFLAIALSELGNISERRTYQLLSGQNGLPDFLTPHPGLNSGLMIAQYTSAALVNENKIMATPASVDTIPTCQLQEDHVSMGGTSAYKLIAVVENCEVILSIEMLTAMQAIGLRKNLKLNGMFKELYKEYRSCVNQIIEDVLTYDYIAMSKKFVIEGKKIREITNALK